MSYIPYTKNPSGIAFFGSSSSDSLLRSDSRLSFDSNTGRLLISGVSVSTSGHQHQSSDIINFASSISGLIPVKGISAGTGIVLSSDSGIFTINVSGNFGLTGEEVDDRVSGLLIGNSGIVLTYDDLNNRLFISTSGLQPSGNYSTVGHTHVSSNISDFNSSVSGLINGIYAPLNSPTLTGVPLAPTAISGTNTNQIASTSFVRTEISNLVNSAPSTLDTLNELASALGNDANFSTTVTNSLAGKANLSGASFTGSISAPSGNFTQSLLVNGTGVSISGHIHTSSDISNFNSSVSGLFPANLTTGIGTSGYLSRWNGTNSLTSGIIFDNGTNVGIGTETPGSPLTISTSSAAGTIAGASQTQIFQVNDASAADYVNLGHFNCESNVSRGSFMLSNNGTNAAWENNVIQFFTHGANYPHGYYGGNLSDAGCAMIVTQGSEIVKLQIGNYGDAPIEFFTNNTQRLKINNNGDVGIGIDSPLYNLDVVGTGNFSQNLLVNGTEVSISGHTHTSSDITNFDTSVSGLLPVKNIIAGYDINITNNSGVYTVASTNLVHVDSQQPQGFVNRTDSRISVSGNIFTIEPTGSSYSYYNKGIKVVKTSGDSLTIPNLTQINYIHFDTINNQISNKTTGFDFSTDIPIAYIAWNSGVGPSGQMTFFAEERHGIVMDTSTHKWIHYTFGAQYVGGLSIGNYVLGGNGSSNSHATISIGNGTLYQEDIEINITDSSSTDPFCQELSPIAQIPVYYHQGTTGQWVKNTATDYPVKYGANGPQYNLLTDGNWTTPDVSPGGATRYFAVWILATNQIDDPIISIMGQRIDSNQGSAESHNSWSDVNLTNLPLSEVKPLYRLIFAGDSDYTNVPKCTLLSILDIRVSVISTIAGVTQNDHGSLFGLGDDDHSQYLHVDNNRTVNAVHNFVNGLTSNGLINSTSGNFNSLSVSGIINANQLLINAPDNGEAIRIEGTSQAGGDVGFAVYNNSGYQANSFYFNTDSDYIGIGVGVGASYIQSSVATDFSVPSLTVNNVPVSISGHTHTSSDITNFNSSVSGLFPANLITGVGTSGYLSRWNGTNVLTSGVIFDNGTNVGINNNNPQYSLDVSGSGNFLNGLAISGVPIGEIIDDEVAGLLVAGSGISLNYNDSANTLTVDTNVSTSLVAGNGVNLDYNVTTDTLSINVIHPFLLMGG